MPDTATVDLSTRSLSLRAATVDEDRRTVEAVLSSETPVEMYDWQRQELIDEILLTTGVTLPQQIPLLHNHDRFSLDDVLGSVRDMRADPAMQPGGLVGLLHFAADDEIAERAWRKVRQGHLTDVSVGYRVTQAVEIEPGQTAQVGNRQFTAGRRRLRVATRWVLREASVVPIGADRLAKMRDDSLSTVSRNQNMNARLRAHLETLGLSRDANDEQADEFYRELSDEQRSAADAQATASEPETRSDPPAPPATEQRAANPQAVSAEEIRRLLAEERARERQRVASLRQLAGEDVPRALLDTAIDEGWDEARASREFLQVVRESRIPDGAPAGHSRSRDSRTGVRSLAAGLMIAHGLDPVQRHLHDGRRVLRSDRLAEQDADYGHEFSRMSMVDIVRECARLDTGRNYRDPEEAWRAAVSGTSLDRVFTTNMYAMLVAGWEETPDTTVWCQVEDVPNFMQHEDIRMDAFAYPERLPRGGTAKHATAEDAYETYRIHRYAKQFVADEQDFIDDRLNALMMMPREMGAAARRVRPDLVYAELLANGTLTETTGALFNSTAETTAGGHANLTTAVLGSTGLKAAITSMGKKRIGKRVLNIRPRYLLVPMDLEFTARELLTSARVNHTGDTDAVFPDRNVLADENMMIIADDRLGANGCTDPETGTAYTGSATNWYLAGANRTVKVIYRAGTGRQPQLRSFQLDRGQWGMGWDINLDIGVKAVDYRALHKSTGAG